MVAFVLLLSLSLQLLTIYFALRLIHLTGRRLAWGLIAGAIALMALRRVLSLDQILVSGHTTPQDLFIELVGLAISLLMAIGIARITPVFRDIRTVAERLRESEERYHSVVNAMAEGLVLEDADGRITAVNPAAEGILGRKAEEMIGMTSDDASWQAVHEDETPFLGPDHPISVALKTGAAQREVVMGIQQPQGGLRWISINSESVVDNRSGRSKAAVVTFRDITERKRADQIIAKYAKGLENAMHQTLVAISNMVEARDPYTSGHERRVAAIARDIGREMGWSEEQCRRIEQAGLIHDIGKISVPAEILAKPAQLSPMERLLVQTHVQKGYEILKDIDFPFPLAEIVYQHHERMDGSGYPQGLKGEDILPEARVLAVADVLESMSSHRPYRPALGMDTALEEIRGKRGSLYDPAAVDALLRLVDKKAYRLPEIE